MTTEKAQQEGKAIIQAGESAMGWTIIQTAIEQAQQVNKK